MGDNEKGSSSSMFAFRWVDKKKLLLSLFITTAVMILEIIGGFLTNSLALISDAGHMFTHAFAISISLIAIFISCKPPCHHRTYGLYRAEILAAFINGIFLLLIVSVIIYESILRFLDPVNVQSMQMLGIAIIGLVTNLVSIAILHGSHKHDMNIRSVFLHMVTDALSSVGIIVAAIIIFYTGWNIIDPLVSLGISLLIIRWSVSLLSESSRVLLEMAPKGMNVDIICNDIRTRYPEIDTIYDVHLWTITPDRIAFTAHIKLRNEKVTLEEQSNLIRDIRNFLSTKYNIIGATIQIALGEEDEECKLTCMNNTHL